MVKVQVARAATKVVAAVRHSLAVASPNGGDHPFTPCQSRLSWADTTSAAQSSPPGPHSQAFWRAATVSRSQVPLSGFGGHRLELEAKERRAAAFGSAGQADSGGRHEGSMRWMVG